MADMTHLITSKPYNIYSLNYICQNLREIDQREIYPLLQHKSSTFLANLTYQACEAGQASVIWVNKLPAAVVGLHPLHGNVCWQVFIFGTDHFKSGMTVIMRDIRKHIRKVCDMYPEAQRMQADSHFEHTEAHEWMERLHGVRESVMPCYGSDGSTYYRYRFLRQGHCFFRYIQNKKEIANVR